MNTSVNKISVIGAGRWGKNIVRTLFELDALAAIAEQNGILRDQLAKDYPTVPIYASVEALLEQTNTAVVVATPVNTHYTMAKYLLHADRDIFIEKPMATTVIECEELNRLAAEKQRIIMVGHVLLFEPAIPFIKDYLEKGKLGKIYNLRQIRRNLGTIRTHENALYSLSTHDLAVLDYLINEPVVSIKSAGQSIITPGIEDDVSVHLVFASGIQAHLHVTWLWPLKDRHLTILGEKGALRFDELQQTVTRYHYSVNQDMTVSQNGQEIIFASNEQPLKLEMQHFLHCVETRQTPRSFGLQSQRVVALMEKISRNIVEKADV